MHDILIYGYDGESVYASDYFDFQFKKNKNILFYDLIKGYENVPERLDYGKGIVLFKNKMVPNNIALYQYKECLGGKLDIEKIGYSMDRNLVKVKLERFLDSPEYVNSVTPTLFDYRLGYTTGFKTLEVLGLVMPCKGTVTIKDVHLIYCHVKLMLERVKYLIQSDSDVELKNLLEKFENILSELNLIEKLVLKEMIKKTWNVAIIIQRYRRFLKLYKEVLVEFVHYL